MESVEVELRDGSRVVVRPIRPDDKGSLEAGFARLSAQSRYQRFLTAINELSPSNLRYLTEVDHRDHEALIAFEAATGEAIAVGRFIRLDDGVSAEAAVTVVDEWQGGGLGIALCGLLADRARAEGITRFTARLLAGNETMFDVLASLGPARVTSRDSGAVEVEIEIELPEQGIGEHMAGVLRLTAGGPAELATPPWGLPEAEG
jgi:RimJ/RimL family protein N-acetyltransferase